MRRRLRGRLPHGVAASVGVSPGEKVVAWGSRGEGSDLQYVIATDHALYLPGQRVAWHTVSRATWNEPVLAVSILEGGTGPARTVRLELDEARDLPPAVHDRVTDSVLVSERMELSGGAGALMVARRDSDDGGIHWSVVFDSGVDPQDPGLRGEADLALNQLRASLGI